jgi:energy-converting hydrogenase Eha subunit G
MMTVVPAVIVMTMVATVKTDWSGTTVLPGQALPKSAPFWAVAEIAVAWRMARAMVR